jgi:putative addiction module component (TIGR02574 family)
VSPTTAWEAVQTWPAEERLEFAFRLWDQLIAEGWRPEPADDLVTALEQRLAAHEADPTNVRSWEQVIQRIRDGR